MSKPIIVVDHASVRFNLAMQKKRSLKEYFQGLMKHELRFQEFFALRDISLQVQPGESWGFVGHNGSGKSTLLKLITGILRPYEGAVHVRGNIAPLLELGAGFDGDLTVKENVYLRGALLGYTKEFVDDEYEHIIDFSELHEFEDVAFKKLSSGMKSKLAFSLASRVNPDILVLDEVLSVGDIGFRKKSETRMREMMSGGTTTMLVSHSMGQIRDMCTKVVWLEKGEFRGIGDTKTMCDMYEKYMKK